MSTRLPLPAPSPDKLHRLHVSSPDEDDAVQEIERCVHDLANTQRPGLTNYQGFDPLSSAAFNVYAAAQRLGLPILFHRGHRRCVPRLYATRTRWSWTRSRLRFLSYSRHRAVGHPWHADTIAVIRKRPHITPDISAQCYRPWSHYTGLRLATRMGRARQAAFWQRLPGFDAERGHRWPARGRRPGAAGTPPASLTRNRCRQLSSGTAWRCSASGDPLQARTRQLDEQGAVVLDGMAIDTSARQFYHHGHTS